MLLCAVTVFAMTACAPQDEPEEGREVLITVDVLNDESEKQIISKFIAAFKEAQPRIDVRANYIDRSYYNPVLTSWAGNTLGDVVWTAGDKHAPLSASGVFEPLNSYVEQTPGVLDDVYPSLIDTAKLKPEDETIYFVPRDYNKLVIAYNKTMFDAAGVEYPQNGWTWQDFLDTCEALRKAMDDGVGGLDASYYPMDGELSWMPVAYTIVNGFGGSFMDDEGNPSLVQNGSTELAEAGLSQFAELIDKYYSGMDLMGETDLFESGYAAMRFMTRPAVGEITGARMENYDFVAFPQMPVNNEVGVGCSGYAINAHSEHKAEAWEFLKFIISEEGQAAFCETGNGVPVLQSMRDSDSWRTKPLEGLNQDAFVYEGTEDLFLNFYCYADPTLYNDLNTKYVQLVQGFQQWDSETGYDSYSDYHDYIVSVQEEIEDLIARG